MILPLKLVFFGQADIPTKAYIATVTWRLIGRQGKTINDKQI